MLGRWWMAALGLMACTATNPAYDPITAGGSMGASTSNGGTVGGSEGVDDTGGSDEGPGQDGCGADLYAINQDGTLYLIDVDLGWSMAMIELEQELSSWALATDPSTGVLYASQFDQPSTMWRISPGSFMRDPTPVAVPSNNVVTIARAAFGPDGDLWLGTDGLGNVFIAFALGAGTAAQLERPGLGVGGDMLFLEGGAVVVPSRDGNLWLTRLDVEVEPLQFPLVIQAAGGTAELTGIARDLQGRPWVATVDGVLARLELDGLADAAPGPIEPVAELELGIFISDLAPIVVPPDGC